MCLPTKDQLRIKRVDVNAMCPLCNFDQETIIHTLIYCSFARLCWDSIGCMSEVQECTSFADWMTGAFKKYNGEELKKISIICWSLWKNINELVWNQKGMEFTEVAESAVLVLN